MTNLAFGSGNVFGISSVSNPTPAKFGVAQDISVDFTAKAVPLFGQKSYPVAVARGSTEIKGKVEFAQITGRVINDIFFGATSATGQTLFIDAEAGTVPASSTYIVTVANNTAWTVDLGVVYAATGIPFTRVASSPAIGQYSVAAGVYTFAAADASTAVKISYLYTTTGGATISVANQAMGAANTFKTVIATAYNNQKSTLTLNACVSTDFGLKTALEDFTKFTLGFEAFADSGDNIGTWSVAEVS